MPVQSLSTHPERAVPPHEDDVQRAYEKLYAGQEFVDDISGAPLDKSMAVKARRTEIQSFEDRGVYAKRRREPWMKVITEVD